ncbi:MAG: SMC-Scp complex subunit ScpB [Vicinamibacterales bacterium]
MADSTERDPQETKTAEAPATEAASNVDAPQDAAAPDAEQLATLADDGAPLVAGGAQEATEAGSSVEATQADTTPDAEQLATLADDGAPPVADQTHEGLESTDAGDDFKRPAAEVKSIVEALIFASPDPLTPKALLKLLDNEPKEDVLAALDELKVDYERPGGLQLVEVAGGFQIVTRADLNEWVRRLFHERSTQKLSVQALESLAVIAYRQPITAIEITEIRGVNTSGVLNTLLERHLVKIVGRKQVVGRPFMYATTKEFLIRFGLKDLTDLPKVEDMAESLGIESRLLVEQTPAEEQLPLSEPDADLPDADLLDDALDGADVDQSDTPESESDDDPEPSVH